MDFYQIVVLGTPFRLEELKASLSEYDVVCFKEDEVDPLFPSLYLYYCATDNDANYNGSKDLSLLAKNYSILPIVEDLKNCKICLPEELNVINVLEVKENEAIDKIKNYILKYFGLIDTNRKVFISYKRDDCEGFAQELFTELSKKNYIPFLDSYIIEPSINFQEHLKHELADSEIMLFINSTNYGKSKWCKEELLAASEMQVGIVHLYFDDADLFKEAELSVSLAMGFEIRRKNLVETLNAKYVDTVFEDKGNGVLVFRDGKIATYILNRIPQSLDLHRAEKIMSQIGEIEIPIRFLSSLMEFIVSTTLPSIMIGSIQQLLLLSLMM